MPGVAGLKAAPNKKSQTAAAKSEKSRASRSLSRQAPRSVYHLDPELAGPLRGWPAVFEHCAGLGCDAVLLGSPFRAGDVEHLNPVLDHDGSATDALALLAHEARQHGLALYLDVSLDHCAADALPASGHPEWFRRTAPDAETALDPRLAGLTASSLLECTGVLSHRAAMIGWWQAKLGNWLDVGLAGFRIAAAPRLHPLQRALIEALEAQARFIDWIPASPVRPVQVRRFERSHDAVTLLVRPDPSAMRAPRGGSAQLECACCQALALAAVAADGLLLPMALEQQSAIDTAGPLRDTARLLDSLNTHQARADGVVTLSAPQAPVTALLRVSDAKADDEGPSSLLILANTDAVDSHEADAGGAWAHGAQSFSRIDTPGTYAANDAADTIDADSTISLAPGEVRLYRANPPAPSGRGAAFAMRPVDVDVATTAPRIVIANLEPDVDGGRYPTKRIVGESVVVEADIFADGHDQVAVRLLWRATGTAKWNEAPMQARGNDRFRGRFTLPVLGRYQFTVEAWRDAWATFRSELRKKHGAGQRLTVEIEEGRQLIEATAGQAKKGIAEPLQALLRRFAGCGDDAARIALLLDIDTATAMAAADHREFATRYAPSAIVDAERSAANFGAWYEIFPRSMSGDPKRHGDFDDVIKALPRIRDMGFDVLYMPPIHPIGAKNRKGRNNTLTPTPDDPGSPYAIGSKHGGHDAIHPELGSIADFRRMRDAAAKQGLELALDFAIQCSPDHPWLKEHPEWFAWRADGTIKYAENPPKKYEDIVNVDFYAEGAKPGLWNALRDVILFWVVEGVRIFRVDNPHTKPLPFWEWLIADVRAKHPDVIFLAEAFTRPGPMQRLAKVGFSQSYTYFTWRNTKKELTEYLTELNTAPVSHFFRPHFFVNTPDINPYFLQNSGRAGHLIRAALAATLSGLWGVYSGFELCEARALPGKEEYLDSEKYEIKAWDWERPGHITREITALNRIRHENPALHSHLGLEFHHADNDQILWFEKATEARDNVLLIAVNLDPHQPQSAEIELPLWRWDLPDHAALEVEDLLDGSRFVWRGKTQRIRLDPAKPYSIWRVSPTKGA